MRIYLLSYGIYLLHGGIGEIIFLNSGIPIIFLILLVCQTFPVGIYKKVNIIIGQVFFSDDSLIIFLYTVIIYRLSLAEEDCIIGERRVILRNFRVCSLEYVVYVYSASETALAILFIFDDSHCIIRKFKI